MNRIDLQDLLVRLKSEAGVSTELDAESRGRLDHLIGEVEARLDADDNTEPHSLGERLNEAVQTFEINHPKVAAILNQLVLALSSSGI